MNPLLIAAAGAAVALGIGWLSRRSLSSVKGQIGPIPVDLPGPYALVGDSIGVGTSRYLQGVESFAVSGYSTARMLGVVEREIRPHRFGTVIVEGHLNDMRLPAARSIDNLRQLYRAVRASGARVVAVTGTPWKGYRNWTAAHGNERSVVNDWILSGADGLVDRTIDVRPSFNDPARNGYLASAWNGGDNLHLNQDGYRRFAGLIQSAIA